MCELKVILDGKIVFEDAIYAKADSDKVIVKNILGASKEFAESTIEEVDLKNTRLLLSSTQ